MGDMATPIGLGLGLGLGLGDVEDCINIVYYPYTLQDDSVNQK